MPPVELNWHTSRFSHDVTRISSFFPLLAAVWVLQGQDVGDDTAILRAVTGQVTARLQAEKRDLPRSFYWHVRGLRRAFDKVGGKTIV